MDSAQRLAVLEQGHKRLSSMQEEKKKVDDLSREYVGTFYSMMLQEMRGTLPGNPLFDGGRGEKMFQQQIDSQYGDGMARAEKTYLRPDGSTRTVFDPLAQQFGKSLTRTLENNIAHLQEYLEKLEASTAMASEVPGPAPLIMSKLDQRELETKRRLEDLQVDISGISSNLMKD